MTAFIISLVTLVLGYLIYGKVAERVFGTDTKRQMPAYTLNDGVGLYAAAYVESISNSVFKHCRPRPYFRCDNGHHVWSRRHLYGLSPELFSAVPSMILFRQ